MSIQDIGAGCFGLVIGWITYRTLRRNQSPVGLSDIASVIAAVGGGAVVSLFQPGRPFAAYAIGLALGFFLYLLFNWLVDRSGTASWLKADKD